MLYEDTKYLTNKMKQPTAQEFIDLKDNLTNTEIAQWFTKRMRELNNKKHYDVPYKVWDN